MPLQGAIDYPSDSFANRHAYNVLSWIPAANFSTWTEYGLVVQVSATWHTADVTLVRLLASRGESSAAVWWWAIASLVQPDACLQRSSHIVAQAFEYFNYIRWRWNSVTGVQMKYKQLLADTDLSRFIINHSRPVKFKGRRLRKHTWSLAVAGISRDALCHLNRIKGRSRK